tara:strand:+ start:239 stop:1117 length:879 start_codon:yes stop_codon:yes gene_type:complete
MILWLASYPKSGNTWVRTIIGQIISHNFDTKKVFETAKQIRLYPSKIDFLDLDNDFKYKEFPKDKKKEIFDKTVINWEVSQSKINLNNKINIFKTHNMLCKLEVGKKLYSFTNLENSLGVIHIVRDPRNIISSLKNHFSFNSETKILEFIMNENQTLGIEENAIPQLLSSWKNHYNSWKRFPKNNLLIKYEDLILNPENEIKKIIKFLDQFFKISLLDNQINEIILNTSFENLQDLEKKGLFDENALNNKTGEVKKFFNMGVKNNWKKLLSENISNKIEQQFKNEMKELGYL